MGGSHGVMHEDSAICIPTACLHRIALLHRLVMLKWHVTITGCDSTLSKRSVAETSSLKGHVLVAASIAHMTISLREMHQIVGHVMLSSTWTSIRAAGQLSLSATLQYALDSRCFPHDICSPSWSTCLTVQTDLNILQRLLDMPPLELRA